MIIREKSSEKTLKPPKKTLLSVFLLQVFLGGSNLVSRVRCKCIPLNKAGKSFAGRKPKRTSVRKGIVVK